MVWLIAMGCTTPTEVIRGVVGDGPGVAAPPAPGVTVSIYDLELGLFDKVVTGDDGSFQATGPRGETIYAEVSGDGLVRSGFVGQLGQQAFEVPAGELYTWEFERLDALKARFGGCSEPGGVIHGEIRLFGAEGSEGAPILRTGFARLFDGEAPIEACYLDDDGEVWLPGADITGTTGQYAFFGVPAGIHVIEYGYFLGDVPILHSLSVYVPEEGIAPQFPAWVDLVLE